MTVLITPKTERLSSGNGPVVAKSEPDLQVPREEKVGTGQVPEFNSHLSRTMPNRADNSRAPDENINKRHESVGWTVVCLPLRDVALPTETQMGQNTEEPRVKSELDNVLGALTDAKSVVKKVGLKWQALENVMREKIKLKAECEEGKKQLDDTRRVLSERIEKVRALESERDDSLVELRKKESMLKDTQDEIKAIHRDHDDVVSDIWDQMRILEAEKDAVVSDVKGQTLELKAQCEALKREADNRLVVFSNEKLKLRREFHSTMLDQKAKFDDELHNVLAERERQEHDLIALLHMTRNLDTERDEMERGRDAALIALAGERNQREIGQEENRILNIKLVAAQSRKRKLEGDLALMREEKNCQQTTQDSLQRNLDEEQRKVLCQTCFVSPKDTIALPCLHWNFCFSCLEKHYQLHKTCPCCQISISGVLRCNIPK